MVNHNWAKVVKGSLNGLKSFGNTVKGGAGAGAAIVVAHPVASAFTVVVLVGVGLAIYYYKNKKQKEDDLKHGNGKAEDDDDSKGASGYFYDPVTKTVTDTPTIGSNIRKRQVAQRASSVTEKNLSKTLDDKKNNPSVSIKSYTKVTATNNLNSNDKFLPDTSMNRERKVEEFIRNIPETAATTGSSVEYVESYGACESHSDENSSILSHSSTSSSWSDISLEGLTTCDNSIRSYSSVGTILSGNYDMCQACDEDNRNPVNTHNEPCQHRYLCNDCARRIFKLFKRCKVCRARIEAIVLD